MAREHAYEGIWGIHIRWRRGPSGRHPQPAARAGVAEREGATGKGQLDEAPHREEGDEGLHGGAAGHHRGSDEGGITKGRKEGNKTSAGIVGGVFQN